MSIARITPQGELIGENDSHTVLVPASQIAFFEVDLPTKSRSQAARLAGFSLEDQLAEDIENLHFSVMRCSDHWLVAVVALQTLETWLAKLKEHQCKAKRLIPDVLAVSKEVDILEEPDQILIKNIKIAEQTELSTALDSNYAGDNPTSATFFPFAVSIPFFETVLQSLNISDAKLDKLRCFYSSDYGELIDRPISIGKNSLNLLQDYGNSNSNLTPWIRPWVKPFIFATFMLLIYNISLWRDNLELQQQIDVSRQYNINLFKQTFPDISRVINPRAQAQARFREIEKNRQRQSGSLITLLNLSIPALIETSAINVSSLRFNNFVLQLQLSAQQVSDLEQAIQIMSKQPQLQVKVDTLGKRNNRAEAKIQISKKI